MFDDENIKWKPVHIAPENFLISNNGKLYNIKTKRLLKPRLSNTGYLRYHLSVGGKRYNMAAHRLVAIAFIPNPENKPTVNHKNEDKTDNRVENLEWFTNAEQNIYGTRIERARKHTDYKARKIDYKIVASKHDYTKQNMCGRRKCIAYKNDEFFGSYNSQAEASRATKVNISKISECIKGTRKQSKGFTFKRI